MNRLLICLSILLRLLHAETLLEVNLKFGEQKYLHESLRYKNGSEMLSFSRVDFLLSSFSAKGVSGKHYPIPDSTLLITSKHPTAFLSTLQEYPEEIVALHYALGLPPGLNLSDPNRYSAKHPLNPVKNNLHWSRETGYIFLALEGLARLDDSPELRGYALHYANQHNFLPLTLKLPTPAKSLLHLKLDFNLQKILAEISFARDGFTTHSQPNDPLAEKLNHNLQSAFSLKRLSGKLPNLAVKEKATQPEPLYLPSKPENLAGFPLKIGSNLPIPQLPTDNPLLKTRVTLGETLFNDPILSQNNKLSCASCHIQSAAFSHDLARSPGFDGTLGRRNSMPLFNMAWKNEFFWDGRSPSLRNQVLRPIIAPHEFGETLPNVVAKLILAEKTPYLDLFDSAFGSPQVTAEKISLALEAYLLTLVSGDSKFDRATKGKAPLTAQEQRGLQLFMTEYEPRLGAYGADCFHCHGGPLFTDNQYHNNGLGDLKDLGRYDATQNPNDKGKFQTPSLRNIALTAPYMHDGRFSTLEEVLDHYTGDLKSVKGLAPLDPNLAKHGGVPLSKEDRAALIAFLHTLTDPQFVNEDRE